MLKLIDFAARQPGLWSLSCKESEVFWLSWSQIPNNTGSWNQIFLSDWLQMSYWIIFYTELLNGEFLLKWYNFFWNFCWNRFFAVHHNFHWF